MDKNANRFLKGILTVFSWGMRIASAKKFAEHDNNADRLACGTSSAAPSPRKTGQNGPGCRKTGPPRSPHSFPASTTGPWSGFCTR